VLAVREHGNGEPLVILHGLFGSSDNWNSVSRSLAGGFRVLAMDLPNHGRSPQTQDMSYKAMAEAVAETMDHYGLEDVFLLGHSMGGKVAMQLALAAPERVRKLLPADIAPKRYAPRHRVILDAMKRVNEENAASRQEADRLLAESIPQKPIRAFLLKNLTREDDGRVTWRINLPVIDAQYESISGWPEPDGVYRGPALFLGGANSDYLSPEEDAELVRRWFPQAELELLEGTGHWLHAEQPERFTERVQRFFAS
jgi:esterase